MKKTLLHTCCGPCACACVPRLKELGREVTMFFANSNIDTREEFERRLKEAEKLAAVEGVRLVALPYDHDEWLREVAAGYEDEPEQGARCARCFRYNLAKAAAYAAARGYDEFTTSLTVSPHKVTKTVFAAAEALSTPQHAATFLPVDFKKREGFKVSTRRAAELGLYRQSYCGCEFSKLPTWRIHHKAETASTNLDARTGRHGDVFTADFQTAGRGRLDHKWLSPPGMNVMMSAVLSVEDIPPEQVATLPLVIGLAVVYAVKSILKRGLSPEIKWPNDVLVGGRKLAGILCERQGDRIIVGIGVNVSQTDFAPEIADKATSLAILLGQIGDRPRQHGVCPQVAAVRSAILRQIGQWYGVWKERGFAAVLPEIREVDFLRGRTISVRQTDDDAEPVSGVSGGILSDGSLDVGGVRVYAGEAHVKL